MLHFFAIWPCLLFPRLAWAWGNIDLTKYGDNRYDVGTASVLIRSSDSNIYVAMQAVGAYVAVGLNPKEGEMPGADVAVCGEFNNSLTATDYHATAYAKPTLDGKQDWTVIDIGRDGTRTYCEITRPKLTCEHLHDFQVHSPSMMVAVMLAWGETGSSGLLYHGTNRGWRHMAFAPTAEATNENEVLHTIQIVAPEITLPSVEGVNLCSYHLLPGVDPNAHYHITRVRTWWDQTPGLAYEKGMAHHITLLGCPTLHPTWQDKDMLSHCSDAWQFCGSTDLVGQSVSIASNEGIPFGKGVAVAVVFLRHFYPKSSTGVIDRGSTFELQYTPTLRPLTLGRLIIQKIDLTVPANTLDHHVRIWYPGACSRRNGKAKLTSINFHMHDRGNSDARSAIVRHIRNGVELAPLFELDNFVEGSASEGWFQIDRDLEPGDDLFFECIYDNPSSVTDKWGAGFSDQMCVASISTRTSEPMASQAYLDRGNGDTTSAFTAHCPVDTYGGLYASAPDAIEFTASQRKAFFAYTPFVPPPSCAPPPTSPPAGSVIFSGYNCVNGYPSGPTNQAHGVNQVYLYAGTTHDGRPYYRGMDTEKHHIFYDENCGGGPVGADGKPTEAWRTGWFIGCGAPSLSESSNLQGATGGVCCNTASMADSGMTVPIGRRSWWRWCGNHADSGMQELNINLVPQRDSEDASMGAPASETARSDNLPAVGSASKCTKSKTLSFFLVPMLWTIALMMG